MPENDKLIFLISTAQHLLKTHLQNELKKEGVLLTPSHTSILFALQKFGPQSMNSMSKILHVKNSTVTGLIDRLEKNELVSRNAVGNDRRKWDIAITEKGEQEITKAQNIVNRVNEKIKEGCSKEEVEVFKKVLGLFYAKFGNSLGNC